MVQLFVFCSSSEVLYFNDSRIESAFEYAVVMLPFSCYCVRFWFISISITPLKLLLRDQDKEGIGFLQSSQPPLLENT